jgi:DNA mismatch repair protein MutL
MDIDPARIDVNVHPQKTEVKFEDESAVWQILNAAVRESLAKMGGIGIMDLDIEDPIEIPVYDPNNNSQVSEPLDFMNPNFNPFEDEGFKSPAASRVDSPQPRYNITAKQRTDNWERLYDDFESGEKATLFTPEEVQHDSIWQQIEFEESESTSQQKLALDERSERIDYIRIGNNYAAVSTDDGMAVIDLNRAYQHIVYTRILNSIGNGSAAIQRQILTEPIQVTHNQYEALKEINSELIDAGFDIEFGDDHNVNVLGVPAELDPNDICNLLNDMLDNAELLDKIPVLARHELIAHTISKNAVSRDAAYTNAECRFIISEILSLKERFYTTDGLQIMWIISNTEINKQFKKR